MNRMSNQEAINWLINLTADIGKSEHHDLWHYEQALYEIKEMLEGAEDTNVLSNDCVHRQAAINAINSYFGFNIEEEYGSAVQEVINGLPSA